MQVNFSETINLLSAPKTASAICSLYKNLQVFNYYTKLHEKSFFLLINDVHDKTLQKGKTDINLLLCYNFAFVLHENALVSCQ